MLNNFIYAQTKALFEAQLLAGNILDEAIVFIEDTKEIWNHGTYFGGTDLSKLENSIDGLSAAIEALNSGKVDKIDGKGLSTEDYTTDEKNKLAGITPYAQPNVQSDWNATDGDAFIKNKPHIPNEVTASTVASWGFITSEDFSNELLNSSRLSFYCVEPVNVILNGETLSYEANSNVDITITSDDVYEIVPTSDNSITALTSFPGPLSTFYSWLEGVNIFSNIVFDMNDLAMYEKWNQGHQGQYHVQMAQYTNCIFWSDNPYISDINSRTNYTLYNSSQLPLCYSSIPENTFKSFYCAYGVTNDPNWSSTTYKQSFANATWATQVFSYYGLQTIGVYDQDSPKFNITLPKDCRGLMFAASSIENAGVFDAINVTNFGAKSGSWRDAFAYCYALTNLYIKNLKVSINVSWSPINQAALEYIINNAANTSAITISLSPHTYHQLNDTIRANAAAKNITLELLTVNASQDSRLAWLVNNGEGTKVLSDNGTYISLDDKQNVIDDLDTIRDGASKGATSIQEEDLSDYIKIGEAVDFATDLTGVVEATAEEFVYRPSAGDKSIRDESAVIRRIKGNSVVWEQKLKSPSDENANWQGYSSSMLTTEIQGREMRCTLTGASVATNPYQVGITGLLPAGSVGGHKYLFCAWAKVSYLNESLGEHFAFEHDWNTWTLYPSISEVDKWIFISRIWESPQNNNRTSTIRPPWAYTSANGAKAGDWYAIKDAMLFDLTAMFGAGNEPATVEEFRKVYNEAYYPYCQPELRGVKTGTIKTVGFNLFDGECARVIGGMSYVVSNYAAAYYSETKNGAQTAVFIKDGVYTPECSGYLYLEGSADATPCVHFQHSGVMDGECAPYVEHILNLPEILKLFPNGMHAVGDVFDEINIDTYIQRCEYRDYVEGDESNAEVLTDGKHTVAKLTNPIVTPLSEPIALDYYCEDWGSEEAIPASSASAPFRADIVYQFNAEGRIRDNSRNIDKLENNINNIVYNISNLSSVATTGSYEDLTDKPVIPDSTIISDWGFVKTSGIQGVSVNNVTITPINGIVSLDNYVPKVITRNYSSIVTLYSGVIDNYTVDVTSISISRLEDSTAGALPGVARFKTASTFSGSVSFPTDWHWPNGQAPVLEPSTWYELSVSPIKDCYAAILVPFKAI